MVPHEINHLENITPIKPPRKLHFQIVILWFFLTQINPNSSWMKRLTDLIIESNIPIKYMEFPDN